MSIYSPNKALDTLIIEEVQGKRVIKMKNQNESNGEFFPINRTFIKPNSHIELIMNQSKSHIKSTIKTIIQNKNSSKNEILK